MVRKFQHAHACNLNLAFVAVLFFEGCTKGQFSTPSGHQSGNRSDNTKQHSDNIEKVPRTGSSADSVRDGDSDGFSTGQASQIVTGVNLRAGVAVPSCRRPTETPELYFCQVFVKNPETGTLEIPSAIDPNTSVLWTGQAPLKDCLVSADFLSFRCSIGEIVKTTDLVVDLVVTTGNETQKELFSSPSSPTTTPSAQNPATNTDGTVAPPDRVFSRFQIDTTPFGAGLAKDLVEYPVLLRLNNTNTDPTIFQELPNSLRVVDEAGRILPAAVDTWDSASGNGLLWVRIPLLKANSSSQFLFVTSKPSGSAPAAPPPAAGTFVSEHGFVLTMHLGQNLRSDSDLPMTGRFSCSFGQCGGLELCQDGQDVCAMGTTSGLSVQAGLIGSARKLDANWETAIRIPDSPALEPAAGFTLSAWVRSDIDQRPWAKVVSKGPNAPPYESYALHFNSFNAPTGIGTNCVGIGCFGATRATPGLTTREQDLMATEILVDKTKWHLWTQTFEPGVGSKFYVDGVLQVTTANTRSTHFFPDVTHDLIVGANESGADSTRNDSFSSITIDELRLSNVARSDEWVRLDAVSQRADSPLLRPIPAETKKN